jgi:hypothetical protein
MEKSLQVFEYHRRLLLRTICDAPEALMSSNTRPNTLMQDRTLQAYRFLLQRTAGPYIGVKTGTARSERIPSGCPQEQT